MSTPPVDRIFAAVFLSGAIAVGIGTYLLPDPLAFQQVSAKVWPACLVVAALLVGVLLWLEGRETPAAVKRADQAAPEDLDDETPSGWLGWAVAGGVAISGFAMTLLGYWVAGIYLIALVALLQDGRANWKRNALIAIVMPGAAYFLFTHGFGQFLPLGILFE